MNIRKNFYFRNMFRVLTGVFMIFLLSTAFSSVSVSSFDESIVENMVEQKCSDSYTRRVPLDSNSGFDNVIKFNGSYIPLSQVRCDYIDRYEYDVGAYWNIDDLRSSVATAVLSIPVIYSLILTTPVLGLYDTRNTKHHLKRYFRFAEVNVLAPAISITIFYIVEVLARVVLSNYFTLPLLVPFLFIVLPVALINRQKIQMEDLTLKEKKFVAGLAAATVLFWIIRTI